MQGNYEQLKAAIAAVIKTNGNNEITGALMQQVLQSIVSQIGQNGTFAGIATPATNPGTPDQNVFYLASEAGVYANFAGYTLEAGHIGVFTNASGAWVAASIEVGSSAIGGFVALDSIADLPESPSDPHIGYIIGTHLYVYVGTGGDTADGKYQDCGEFRGPAGEKGDQGNSGYSGAAGELEVVNNLTDGGATSALSAEMGKVLADGLDKAFENWKGGGSSEDETLYQDTAARFTLDASTKLINEGDHIQLKVENGSGTYTFYIYYTTASNPKRALGSVTDSGVIDIPSFSYGGYASYNRVYAQGSTAAKFTLIRKASAPAVEISFTDTVKEQIDDMIQDAIGSISLDNYDSAKEEPIAEGLTVATNIFKTSIDVNVGDYIKVVAGTGTTGTWALAKYDSAQQTTGKMTYFENLAPNETRYIKILTDYLRLYFYKVNSCDAPLSVYKASPLKCELLELETGLEDYSKYYNKGNAPKSFTQAPCIIVGGQSNAEGRVPAADLPSYITLPDSNVKVWSGSAFADLSTSYFSQNRWAFDIVTAHYLGLVEQCYFVKYAKGATHLHKLGTTNEEAWSADYEDLGTSLLRILENRIRGAIGSQQPLNIRAMLWHQGEGDYSPATISKYYYKDLKKFIAYIRGVCGNERLPFISGTISHLSGQYSAIVEEAQLKVAAEDPYVTYIDMSGAPLLDAYHFNAASSEYLGKMMYDALIDYGVISGQKLAPTRPW